MKSNKAYRLFPALLAAMLLIGCLLPLTAVAAPPPPTERYGRSVLQRMDKGGRLTAAYDALVDGATKVQEKIPMPQGNRAITEDDLVKVFDAFYSDHPECFWINGGYNYSVYKNGIVESVSPICSLSGNQLKNARQAFDRRTDELIAGLKNKSDYDKALILHDRLAAAVDYQSTANDQNAYGALVEGKAVCAGYALSYQHLLQQVGISAWTVSGRSVNPATGKMENHAWNAAKLDGDWYYTDVTWDDQNEDLFHAYFDLTGEQMAEDHVAEQFADYLPDAHATADNYFVHNNGVITGFDVDKLAKLLKEGNMTARMYINGNKASFEAALRDEKTMRKVLAKLGYAENVGYSWSEKTLGHEIILTIHVDGDSAPQKGDATTTKGKDTTIKGKSTTATTQKGGKTTGKTDSKVTAPAPDSSVDGTVSTSSTSAVSADVSVPEESRDAVSQENEGCESDVSADGHGAGGAAASPVILWTIVGVGGTAVVAGGAGGLVWFLRRRV